MGLYLSNYQCNMEVIPLPHSMEINTVFREKKLGKIVPSSTYGLLLMEVSLLLTAKILSPAFLSTWVPLLKA